MKGVKVNALITKKGIFCSFNTFVNARGLNGRVLASVIRKKIIENGLQFLSGQVFFVPPEVLNSIKKNLEKRHEEFKETSFEMKYKSGFKILKENILNSLL